MGHDIPSFYSKSDFLVIVGLAVQPTARLRSEAFLHLIGLVLLSKEMQILNK